jgi:hypothetical protein
MPAPELPTPIAPMANPIKSQSQPAPSITQSFCGSPRMAAGYGILIYGYTRTPTPPFMARKPIGFGLETLRLLLGGLMRIGAGSSHFWHRYEQINPDGKGGFTINRPLGADD